MREEWGEYDKPWNLPPSDELDAAWDDLLVARDIRVSPAELGKLNGNTTNRVQLTDGDYVAVLGPYHLLHCMNIMRRVIHWDYYGPLMSEEERGSFIYTHEHSDHCLELYRQHVMCHGYPTFYTGEWVADSKSFPNKELRPGGLTKCVNWDSMDGWARQRALNVQEHKVKPGPFEKHYGKHESHKTGGSS
ncbi:hypothetical protein P280DRAFT_492029 [Massarina eburnea CBS 473.64]|uniref:Tat pathway signal sequence n=1 Tax=Massarina eburnea CBS 473.64 TaxID=1395130 RepID=A0A6A6RUQ0_9PLEO|nr:hypothetical protein P280DRAFT_492029 [Massarina eburnea CBS 473.64]